MLFVNRPERARCQLSFVRFDQIELSRNEFTFYSSTCFGSRRFQSCRQQLTDLGLPSEFSSDASIFLTNLSRLKPNHQIFYLLNSFVRSLVSCSSDSLNLFTTNLGAVWLNLVIKLVSFYANFRIKRDLRQGWKDLNFLKIISLIQI